jgi:hypothetical protein
MKQLHEYRKRPHEFGQLTGFYLGDKTFVENLIA